MIGFPSYTIQSLLGDAGDFRLYLAARNADGREAVSILKVPSSARTSPTATRRLEHELEIARELDPQLVLKPLRLLRHEGNVALVFKDKIRQTLAKEIGKPMELDRFLRLAIQAASALAEVHRHGFIHKDVKPQHFLLTDDDRLRITGFGIASAIPRESQPAQPPNLLEGTLAYMSPEQTGRMNRATDCRSDFYSLGVMFYQMLTGRLPFQAADPLEWIHCHIARFPKSPAGLRPEIPAPVSEIVMKLMAKVAEDRYQNAVGLRRDLERCLAQWEADGNIQPFPLGEGDVSERFQIPQKLYGRGPETGRLLAAFERVAEGKPPELVLVSGYPGIGKSSLVQELQKPVVSRRGFFISGKFDQVKRGIPYSTLLFTFTQLIHQILSESEERIGDWKEQLAAALDGNGQLLVDLIPELELLIGRQPAVAELPLTQAQNRLHRVFARFLGVFAQAGHPLALFLDDLQWIDSASLLLLRFLMTAPETRYFLLVGAFRDNEVEPSHPLLIALEEIRRHGIRIHRIALGALSTEDLEQFVADTLCCDPRRAAPLAELVREKTGSNPFFVIQFLSALHQEGLIAFDPDNALWQWDIGRIRQHEYTDNVVDFMIAKLARLPVATQHVMQFAACVGHEGAVATLALISGQTERETGQDLLCAVREGLMLQAGGHYQFLHDRVQQAAYALIPRERRQEIHLQIARLLLASVPEAKTAEENIFEIVNQLNFGAELIALPEERTKAARLNLMAGRRAQSSTAYASALIYYRAGIGFLPDDPWTAHGELAFALHFGQAQCEYISGHSGEALRHFDELLDRTGDPLQKAEIYRMEVDIHTVQTELALAVECGLKGLELFEVSMPAHPAREQVLVEYDEVWSNLGNRPIEDLASLPLMTDAGIRAAMRILEALYTGALCTDENLFLLWSSRMVNLSLRYGNCEAAVTGYSYLGLALGSLFGRYREGYLFGKVGHDLVEKRGMVAYRAKVNFIFGDCISYWHRHLRKNIEALQVAFATALQVADLPTACYCCNHRAVNLLVLGEPLDSLHREAHQLMEFTRHAQLDASTQTIVAIDRLVQNMRGLTEHFSTFSGDGFDETGYESRMDAYGQPIVTCWYYIMKLQARFMSGDFETAIAAARKARPLLWSSMGHPQESEYWYYYPLALAGQYHRLSPREQQKALETLKIHERKLYEWARLCPPNFLNKAALVEAENARIAGRPMEEVTALYEQAVKSARENGFVQNEGIANELASGYYRERGFETISRGFLREARYCYQRWGADGKVRQLEQLYPWLRESRSSEYEATIAAPFEKLDLMTVLKAQQAISGEIMIDRLVETLLRIVLENAGAQKACLFMEPGGGMFTVIHEGNRDVKFRRVPQTETAGVALSMVNYVKRTGETVILADASADSGDFVADEYLRASPPKSLLCMPVVRQAKLVGVLYLENKLAANAFTPDRRALLEMVASQAAISLEIAWLYSDLQRSKNEQQDQAEVLRLILNSMGEGVIVANERAEVLLENPTAKEILGTTGALTTIEEWPAALGLYHSDQTTLYRSDELPIVRAIHEESTDDTEIYMRPPDSHQGRWIHVTARPLIDINGKVRGGVAVLSDISARIEAARREREAKESAEAANRTKDQFLAMLSHELRTPLTPVLNGINTLEETASGETASILGIMRRNLLLEMRIIDDLLDITRITKGKLQVHPEPVDALKVLRDAVETCQPQLSERLLQLRFDATEQTINADAGRLQQVLRNLIQNAVRFSRPGGVIELHAYNPGPGLLAFSCKDDGVGIDPGNLSRIFKPFEQSDRVVERGYGGLGLGLAISKALVEAQDGSISVRSEGRGKGATFEVILPTVPREKLAEPERSTPPSAATHGEVTDITAALRLLLVEDHNDTRQTLERLLKRTGYQVTGAPDCQSALRRAGKETFDLIICDIGLPDGNGYDLIREIHRLQPVPAISLSGFGMDADFEQSRAAGFAEHLVKPIDFKRLKETLQRLLAGQTAAASRE